MSCRCTQYPRNTKRYWLEFPSCVLGASLCLWALSDILQVKVMPPHLVPLPIVGIPAIMISIWRKTYATYEQRRCKVSWAESVLHWNSKSLLHARSVADEIGTVHRQISHHEIFRGTLVAETSSRWRASMCPLKYYRPIILLRTPNRELGSMERK